METHAVITQNDDTLSVSEPNRLTFPLK